jgi:E3 ubiquitin-protein ligase RNF14
MTAISLGASGNNARSCQTTSLHSGTAADKNYTGRNGVGGKGEYISKDPLCSLAMFLASHGSGIDNPIVLSDNEEPTTISGQPSKSLKGSTSASASKTRGRRVPANELQRAKKRPRTTKPVPFSTASAPEATFSCVVCGDHVPSASLPSSITAACSHPPQTCRPCIASWISSRLQTSGHGSLTCPQCKERLDDNRVREFAAPETYQQYEDLVLRSSLSDNPEFFWCIGPGCPSGQLHVGSNPIFRCAQCDLRSCIKHKVTWHNGLTCAEYDDARIVSHRREKEEAASKKKVKETSRRCPGENCGWRIEKNDGCDHMTCRNCKTEFCWLCKANYNDIRRRGNAAHASTCPHHPTNDPENTT